MAAPRTKCAVNFLADAAPLVQAIERPFFAFLVEIATRLVAYRHRIADIRHCAPAPETAVQKIADLTECVFKILP